jgi:hypothetical protein
MSIAENRDNARSSIPSRPRFSPLCKYCEQTLDIVAISKHLQQGIQRIITTNDRPLGPPEGHLSQLMGYKPGSAVVHPDPDDRNRRGDLPKHRTTSIAAGDPLEFLGGALTQNRHATHSETLGVVKLRVREVSQDYLDVVFRCRQFPPVVDIRRGAPRKHRE